MARASKEILQAAVMGFGIPALLLVLVITVCLSGKRQNSQPSTVPTLIETVPSVSESDPLPKPSVTITVLVEGELVQMDLEEYVVGAVLSEMPASFQQEALKAQAVAARTYALQTYLEGKKHAGAICSSNSCCQGYLTDEDYILLGWQEKYVQRVRKAVAQTEGQVLCYEGKLIRAPYFSCSGGATEAALTVWGRDYPYLQSVESPGEEETVYYTHAKEYTILEFQEKLGVVLTGSPHTWFGAITYTEGGGIDTMQIGGVEYRGTTLRSLLGLRSTVFQVVATEDTVRFETRGYGHRVGMSQYGAQAMALEGSLYEQILAHYYQGTQLMDLRLLEWIGSV